MVGGGSVGELGSGVDRDIYNDPNLLLNFSPPFYLNASYVYLKILPTPQS